MEAARKYEPTEYEIDEMKAFHLGMTLAEYRNRLAVLMGQVDEVKGMEN